MTDHFGVSLLTVVWEESEILLRCLLVIWRADIFERKVVVIGISNTKLIQALRGGNKE